MRREIGADKKIKKKIMTTIQMKGNETEKTIIDN